MSQATAPLSTDIPAAKKVARPRKAKVAKPETATGETPAAPGENIITVELKPKAPVKRSFAVVSVTHAGKESEFKGGKFHSKTPAGAARKAAGQACKAINEGSDEPCTVEIVIREVTKNGTAKEYSYEATRQLGEKKVDFAGNEGGVNINFKYSMTLKSLKKNAAGVTIATEDVATDEATAEGQA